MGPGPGPGYNCLPGECVAMCHRSAVMITLMSRASNQTKVRKNFTITPPNMAFSWLNVLSHFTDGSNTMLTKLTVQQAGVAAPKKIWEPPDMSLLHYFLNDQLSLSDSVLS